MFLYLICKKCSIEQLNVRNYQYKIIFVNLIADANKYDIYKQIINK